MLNFGIDIHLSITKFIYLHLNRAYIQSCHGNLSKCYSLCVSIFGNAINNKKKLKNTDQLKHNATNANPKKKKYQSFILSGKKVINYKEIL